MHQFRKDKGAVLIMLVFVIMVGLSGVLIAFMVMMGHEMRSTRLKLSKMQAFYIAEAGLAKARWALTAGGESVPWSESDVELGEEGTFTFSAADDNGDGSATTITSTGYIPDDTSPIAERQVVEADVSIDAGGLTNLSLDATLTASSESGGHPASDANDGDVGTGWQANDKDDAWLKLDYGSATVFDTAVINGQSNINSVTIQYSDNDIDYDDVAGLLEAPDWTYTFDSVEARYLRINMEVDATKKAGVDELESYDSSEVAEPSLGQGDFSITY